MRVRILLLPRVRIQRLTKGPLQLRHHRLFLATFLCLWLSSWCIRYVLWFVNTYVLRFHNACSAIGFEPMELWLILIQLLLTIGWYYLLMSTYMSPWHIFLVCSLCWWKHMLRYPAESVESDIWCSCNTHVDPGTTIQVIFLFLGRDYCFSNICNFCLSYNNIQLCNA